MNPLGCLVVAVIVWYGGKMALEVASHIFHELQFEFGTTGAILVGIVILLFMGAKK